MTTDTLSKDMDQANAATLMASVRMGDPASCESFVALVSGPLYSYLYWLTGDGAEASAVFKDTLLYLYLNPSRVRKERSVREWVFRHATQTYLSNRQRQMQRRSSLDFILRGGLNAPENAPWADWMSQCPSITGEAALALEPIVDGLVALSENERVALLLTTVVGFTPKDLATTLRLSTRKARRYLVSAFQKLVAIETTPANASDRKLHRMIQRRALALESGGQAKKLDRHLDAEPTLEETVSRTASTLKRLQELPHVATPNDLAERTMVHLAEGHAALETRIATWGFRFMQVTVPLFILAILAIILFPAITRSREMARRAAAADNLRDLGSALRAYSEQSYGNRYPPLTSQAGLWVPDLTELYPNYINDPALLINPTLNDPALIAQIADVLNQSPPDWKTAHEIMAQSYVYTGYTLLNSDALAAFIQALNAQESINLQGDIETVSHRFFRLRQGVEQFFMGDLNAEPGTAVGPIKIPVLFEYYTATGFGGNPEGANVLYLDGSVSYIPFGSAFPVDETVMALLKTRTISH